MANATPLPMSPSGTTIVLTSGEVGQKPGRRPMCLKSTVSMSLSTSRSRSYFSAMRSMPIEARTEARNLSLSTLGSTSYCEAMRSIVRRASSSVTAPTVSSSSATERKRSSGPICEKSL